MHVVKLEDCAEIVAGDDTLLREILHPNKTKLELRYSLARAILPPGKSSYLHSLTTSEVFHVISGKTVMHINNEAYVIESNDTVYIPPNAKQFLINKSDEPFVFLEIVDPGWLKANETVYEN